MDQETGAAALSAGGANGMPVWQSWCLGLDPRDSASVVLCKAAADQPAEPGAFRFTAANLELPDGLEGVVVTAYLDRKSGGGGWSEQASKTVGPGDVELTASVDGSENLNFFRIRVGFAPEAGLPTR